MSPPCAQGALRSGVEERGDGERGEGRRGGDLTGRQMNRAHGIHALRIQFPICATRTTGGRERERERERESGGGELSEPRSSFDLVPGISPHPTPHPHPSPFTEECSNLPRPRAQLTSPDPSRWIFSRWLVRTFFFVNQRRAARHKIRHGFTQ